MVEPRELPFVKDALASMGEEAKPAVPEKK